MAGCTVVLIRALVLPIDAGDVWVLFINAHTQLTQCICLIGLCHTAVAFWYVLWLLASACTLLALLRRLACILKSCSTVIACGIVAQLQTLCCFGVGRHMPHWCCSGHSVFGGETAP